MWSDYNHYMPKNTWNAFLQQNAVFSFSILHTVLRQLIAFFFFFLFRGEGERAEGERAEGKRRGEGRGAGEMGSQLIAF